MAVIRKNVRSTVQKDAVYTDELHVYVVDGQHEITVTDDEGNEHIEYEVETETEYDKDEYIMLISQANNDLEDRTSTIEDAIVELSEAIYE